MNSGLEQQPTQPEGDARAGSDSDPKLACRSCGGELDEGSLLPLCPACLLQAPAQRVSNSQGHEREGQRTAALSWPASHRCARLVVEIGRDRRTALIAQGAMGVTYRAIDRLLCRPVALKL